jgi:hypothetical protein
MTGLTSFSIELGVGSQAALGQRVTWTSLLGPFVRFRALML